MIRDEFQDIFSKKKTKEKPKQKIIIDYRERESLIPSILIKQEFQIEFRNLKVGDYIVNDIAIERKTKTDFINSMLNGRLVNQLQELQQYERKALLIEGIEEAQDNLKIKEQLIHPNSVKGFIISILLNYRIPIIFSKDSKDSANFISLIARKKPRDSPLNIKKKTLDKKEQMEFILQGFPGIGSKKSKALLEKFGSIKNIINSSEEELKKIIGKKSEIFQKIIKTDYNQKQTD